MTTQFRFQNFSGKIDENLVTKNTTDKNATLITTPFIPLIYALFRAKTKEINKKSIKIHLFTLL